LFQKWEGDLAFYQRLKQKVDKLIPHQVVLHLIAILPIQQRLNNRQQIPPQLKYLLYYRIDKPSALQAKRLKYRITDSLPNAASFHYQSQMLHKLTELLAEKFRESLAHSTQLGQ
jgi:hypothetical protein